MPDMYKGLFIIFSLLLIVVPRQVLAAKIAVTLPPLAGLVSMLDHQADVLCLLRPGSEPHHFQLSPQRIEALKETQLLIRASFDDGGWPLPPGHANTVDLWPQTDHGWLSPKAVRVALAQLAQALTKLKPEKADAIATSLKAALHQTREIEQAWRSALESSGVTGVIMQHPAWRRLLQEMNIPVLAVLESSHHGFEHGPHRLEDALEKLNRSPDSWLIAESGHSNRALDWLEEHADIKPRRITLNALGSCQLSWAESMQQNLGQLSAPERP